MHARVSQETLAWVFPRVHARVLEKSLNGSRRRVISTRGQSRIFASSECFRHLPKEVPFTSVPIIIAMFSGIIEGCGRVVALESHGDNLDITLSCPFASELKIDQSIAHNGVCLTVVAQSGDTYTVTAIRETLDRSNLGKLQIGDEVNLERSMLLGGRLDGHIVQGHVDMTALCTSVEEANGSWLYRFEHQTDKALAERGYITVEKGSVAVNGVSLTVCDSEKTSFGVAIIPYTHEHTNFKHIRVGSVVNLEFDIVGKYLCKMQAYEG